VRVVSEKGYGFIKAVSQGEYFFHRSDFSGFWDDLVKDMQGRVEVSVSFEAVESNKGLRAANVRRTDHPNAA
jgi:cold shock CspA family protein